MPVRLWLSVMEQYQEPLSGDTVRIPRVGRLIEEAPNVPDGTSWQAIDLPGYEQALVLVEGVQAVQDGIAADRAANPGLIAYLSPNGIDTRAQLRTWLQTQLGDLPVEWRQAVRNRLENHGIDLSRFNLSNTVRDVLRYVIRQHLKRQRADDPINPTDGSDLDDKTIRYLDEDY